MNKRKSLNIRVTAVALTDFIFQNAERTIIDFEKSEEFKQASEEFNSQPRLKRMLDFCILYFWTITIACEGYYEHDVFVKICDIVKGNIFERFSEFEKDYKIFGVVLKDYVRDKDELVLFYRNYTLGDETVVGFNVLLDTLITKRLFDYNSALHLDLS